MNLRINHIFLLLFIINPFLQAQQSLVVEYESSYIIQFLGSGENKASQSFSQSDFYELQINDKQSFYTKVEKINNSQGGSSIMMSGLLPKNLFLDFEKNIQKREWEVETKKYIVVDSILTEKYQLTREKSTYLGYNVKQAIRETEYGKIVIWYAPDLPAKFGPSNYINLPGLVLKVESYLKDSNEANSSLRATSIKIKDKLKLGQLFKGKEVNATEFEKIEEEYNNRFKAYPLGVDKS